MQFSLRTLVIVTTLAPAFLCGLCWLAFYVWLLLQPQGIKGLTGPGP